jgi:hypothetical protein
MVVVVVAERGQREDGGKDDESHGLEGKGLKKQVENLDGQRHQPNQPHIFFSSFSRQWGY